ncbi:MAG: TetR/AcrR family transcriptional regulator [Clostridiales Family XIII bacterium]|nr:TetR/AcrR family transcriptional regulator [Clostridiales Family XIII bacterium]
MEGKKLDRRVRYTKMVIRDAFIGLLAERAVAKITVKEICLRADVNRATFYAHYRDPFDLLHQIEDGFVEDISRYLADTDFTGVEEEASLAAATRICEYVKQNAPLCIVLFGQNGDARFLDKAKEIIRLHSLKDWFAGTRATKREAEYILHFVIGGAVEVIQRWVAGGLRESPAEVAGLVLKVAVSGSAAYR